MSPKGERGKREKGRSFIDIRIRGRKVFRASSQEEATQMAREYIMDEIMTAHPSFEETGLPDLWQEWLDSQTAKMLGIEMREKDDDVEEDIEISWSNIKGGKMYKDGPLSHGVDRRRKKRQSKL
jgi:hypothetical protein